MGEGGEIEGDRTLASGYPNRDPVRDFRSDAGGVLGYCRRS